MVVVVVVVVVVVGIQEGAQACAHDAVTLGSCARGRRCAYYVQIVAILVLSCAEIAPPGHCPRSRLLVSGLVLQICGLCLLFSPESMASLGLRLDGQKTTKTTTIETNR